MGLTVSRQMAKHLSTVKKGEIFPSTVKKAVVSSRQTVLRSFKCYYFSCTSWTTGSQRVVLTGTSSLHVPKYSYFTVFSTNFRLN